MAGRTQIPPEAHVHYLVNVEVFLHRKGQWLLIRRGQGETHAAGSLAGVGGKVDAGTHTGDILEVTARREVAEEIGVDLAGAPLRYVMSTLFETDDGQRAINVVFMAPLPEGARPIAASPDEVAELLWLTEPAAQVDPRCPVWIRDSLHRAAALLDPAPAVP